MVGGCQDEAAVDGRNCLNLFLVDKLGKMCDMSEENLYDIPVPPPLSQDPPKIARYSEKDHKVAFDTWLHAGTYTAAANQISADSALVRMWSRDEYVCPFGCPWHGWDRLKDAHQEGMRKELALVVEKQERDLAAAQKPRPPKPPSRHELVKRTVRSDMERLAQLEVLYARAFHEATGVRLSCPQLIDDQGKVITTDEILQLFDQATAKSKSFEQAVRCISMILTEINRILDASGLRKATAKEETPEADTLNVAELSIDDVRKVRELHQRFLQTPPEKREALQRLLDSEDDILLAQLEGPRSVSCGTEPADSEPLP